MTPEQTLALCRYVKAVCPQQAIDQYTPLAWQDFLGHHDYDTAKAAVQMLVNEGKAFIQIAELVAGIKRIRSKRIAEAGDLTPPPGTELEQRQWLRDARRQIGDGVPREQVEGGYGELKPRNLADLRAIAAPNPSPADVRGFVISEETQ